MNIHAANAHELHRSEARCWFESLRDRLCAEVELLEREAPATLFGQQQSARFVHKPWVRTAGEGGGVGGFLVEGRLFEKAGIHVSSGRGRLTPELTSTMPGDGKQLEYVSASISLIIHPRSPRVPTVHMNTRFLATSRGWFGGGADLTPMLTCQRDQAAPDAIEFHARMRQACEAHGSKHYPKFKAWADEYFFLPHRGQARGVGGLFYDHLDSGDFERDFALTREVGLALLDVYPKIVRRRMVEPWDDEDRRQQLAFRSLYAEFNLLYDRGTTFGLKTGGNVETILSSMPPLGSWRQEVLESSKIWQQRRSNMKQQIVMDHAGDTRHCFEPNDAEALMRAERRFRELTSMGYTAAVREASGEARVVRNFDATAEQTVFYPRLVGG
ncbi:oxygen-dependent coproporphyrinogen oxidase [Bradyrhizobium jicamae]|nr:oxygen-dependent coproporphyrinogen oxidase [Bradyrhizobium jicamae]